MNTETAVVLLVVLAMAFLVAGAAINAMFSAFASLAF